MTDPARPARADSMPFWATSLGMLALSAAVLLLLWGLYSWLWPVPQALSLVFFPPTSPLTANPAQRAEILEQKLRVLELQVERQKMQLDYAEKQSDRIQRTVGVLVSIGAVFAAALGLTAYFNLKQILESGKDELARLKDFRVDETERLTKFREDEQNRLTKFHEAILSQYPVLGEMDKSLSSILENSRIVLSIRTVDWRQKVYSGLDHRAKQQVALAELKVATFDFFSLKKVPSYCMQAREVYHSLGRFYGSKYCVAKSAGQNSLEDLWRSILYFNTALGFADEAKDRRSVIHADLGLMHLERSYLLDDHDLDKQKIRLQAESAFIQSINDSESQPAALGGLAWLQSRGQDKRTAIQVAIETLSTLISKNPSPNHETQRFVRKAHFNRACYRCELVSYGDYSYDDVESDLEEAKKYSLADEEVWTDFLKDLQINTADGQQLHAFALNKPAGLSSLSVK